jgi:hypothetical protein
VTRRELALSRSPDYYARRYGLASRDPAFRGRLVLASVPGVQPPIRKKGRLTPRARRLLLRSARPVVVPDPTVRRGEDRAPFLVGSAVASRSPDLALLLDEHIRRTRREDASYSYAFDGRDVRTELHDALLETVVLSDQLEVELQWVLRAKRHAPAEWSQAAVLVPQMQQHLAHALAAWLQLLDVLSVAIAQEEAPRP